MKNIIELLPDSIANQIAAGEVVQRPSSAVKELLENSIDSKSSKIKLIIKNAGKSLIQVIDNGIGMSEVDARMSFERHATSKIKKSEDLFQIKTMGFRGEALASIAAIAQVELETTVDDDVIGTKIVIEGSNLNSQTSTSVLKGTKIAIKNLFFNVPARRNFLKSNSVEMKHIIDEFTRIALSYPEISFLLYQDNKEIYHLPQSKLSHRIVHLFGKNYQNQLISCEENTEYVNIKGYIGKPEYAKKTRGEQFFFVNNRYIKSPYLHYAVKSVFKNLILDNQFPFYVLFLEIDPKHIDVNVHPSKAEIKFDDERLVYSILEAAVRKSISKHHVVPSIDFKQNVNSSEFRILEKAQEKHREMRGGNSAYVNFKNYDLETNKKNSWDEIFKTLNITPKENNQIQSVLVDNVNDMPENENIVKNINSNKLQIHNKYILTQIKSGLVIIDQNAAHQRVLYEKFLNQFKNNSKISQQLLFPYSIKMNNGDMLLLQECSKELNQLGFIIQIKSKEEIFIKGMPSEFSDKDPKSLLEGLIEQYKLNKGLSLEKKESIIRALSKRSAFSHGVLLSEEEVNYLIDQLFACANPNYTADGYRTFIKIGIEEIESKFVI
ncbi:MAG: DNA mismatch repair endonuclease MutL [Bacteroidetes bacterium]|nr:DNA mismatch repair endonuclease MutL [Bacteroidota bacterium]